MNIERESIDLLKKMVAAKSVNPSGKDIDDEGYKTNVVAKVLGDYLKGSGFDVEYQEVEGRDLNVVGKLDVGADNTILLEGHLDTVDAGEMVDAFKPRMSGGTMYGRGACDAKGSLVSMVMALKMLKEEKGLKTNVVLAGVCNEEHTFTGIRHLIKKGLQVNASVVGEPTELKVVRATKGLLRWVIETKGVSAHTAVAHLGKNAIYKMSDVISKIKDLDKEYKNVKDDIVGPPLITVGMISGGIKINVVPDWCRIEIDRRIIPGEEPMDVWNELKAEIEDEDTIFHEPYLTDHAMLVEEDEPVVKAFKAAVAKLVEPGDVIGVPYGTDASKLVHEAGIPTVIFGPGSIDQAHSDDEYLDISKLITAAQIHKEAVMSFRSML